MKTGDRVRLTSLPPGLPVGDADLPTRATFGKCVGRDFLITGFNELGMAELDIETATGSIGETIWIEPQFLELISR
jgi:hypothetical protein